MSGMISLITDILFQFINNMANISKIHLVVFHKFKDFINFILFENVS